MLHLPAELQIIVRPCILGIMNSVYLCFDMRCQLARIRTGNMKLKNCSHINKITYPGKKIAGMLFVGIVELEIKLPNNY